MNKHSQMFCVGLTSLIIGLSTGILLQSQGTEEVVESSYIPAKQQTPNTANTFSSDENDLSYDDLYQKAQLITVKNIIRAKFWLRYYHSKKANVYTVVTNNHVLIFGNSNQSYRIQTPDKQIYNAQVFKSINFNNTDLGLLQFQSSQNYQIASLSRLSKINSEEDVFFCGLSAEVNSSSQEEFVLSTGKLKMFSDVPFGGGYQIGYTNKVQKGMSGGPLFNRKGEIIGINGVHRYPLWGNPYIFQDGSVASPEKKELMSQYSWAIPIQIFLNLAPQFANEENKITAQ